DTEIFAQVRRLVRNNWRKGAEVRVLGVHASSFDGALGQGDLLDGDRRQRWQQALSAADRLRDRFGESSITLATGMNARFRERTHENPAGLPGKDKKHDRWQTNSPKAARRSRDLSDPACEYRDRVDYRCLARLPRNFSGSHLGSQPARLYRICGSRKDCRNLVDDPRPYLRHCCGWIAEAAKMGL